MLAQACLAVLLQLGDHIEEDSITKSSSLAKYAARYWAMHAWSGGVSLCLQKAMEYLFDPDKPHFVAWLQIYNVDTEPKPESSLYLFTFYHNPSTVTSPLYYAAFCGLKELVDHLFIKHPWSLYNPVGFWVTPLVAALAEGHPHVAKFLYDRGAQVNVHGACHE